MSPLLSSVVLLIATILNGVQGDSSSSFDSQCTGPIGLVTAFAHPKVVLVNQPIRYKNYRRLCRQNGYEPLMIRDERELGRVLRELKSLHCHHGPAWVQGYWRVEDDPRGKKTPIAVTTCHGGIVEIYPRNAFVKYPALCRSKQLKQKTKSRNKKSKKSKRYKKSKKRRACKRVQYRIEYPQKYPGHKYPAKCLNGACAL